MEAASGRGRLRSPPCKVLAEQLRLGARRDGQPSAWLLDRPGGHRAPLDVSVVWMQGTVLEVRPEHNTSLQLLDETGSFTVVGAAGVPQGRPCTSRALKRKKKFSFNILKLQGRLKHRSECRR
ncbi:recQ-mediated genome instability protein 2 isoform X2 [Hypanus sabinus]|uniref:recQ-mediated genome instability protein 2 isoform X2 n=1 Tax=Hypanus sabinus TaxID=79690 RepID=UPI0028C48F69|nr:recQ-mediated genome instability protein 2 isoform X2 [Hypanus sabinus]